MPPHNRAVAHAHRTSRQNVIRLTVFQKLGADVVRQPHPAEQRQQHQQYQQTGIKKRRQDNQQIKLRHPAPDFDKALHQKVGLTAEITLHRAGNHADDGRYQSQRKGEQQRIAESVNQTRQDITTAVVRAEQVPFGRTCRVRLRVEIIERIGVVGIGQINGVIAV